MEFALDVRKAIDRNPAPLTHLSPFPASEHYLDRGMEFACVATLQKRAKMSYFCLPSAPWQMGSVEKSNGRMRRFLPSDTDMALLSDKEIQAIANSINSTPRKCVNYRKPDVTPSLPPAGIRAGRLFCASARLKQWAA